MIVAACALTWRAWQQEDRLCSGLMQLLICAVAVDQFLMRAVLDNNDAAGCDIALHWSVSVFVLYLREETTVDLNGFPYLGDFAILIGLVSHFRFARSANHGLRAIENR
jgi:hypothetical protein